MRRFRLVVPVALLVLVSYAVQIRAEEAEAEAEVEEIVVVATRLETPVGEVASTVTVLSGEELAKTGETFLGEALRTVPGLDVVRSGGPGQQTSVFLRGSKSGDTLVLIDGVVANDPISPDRTFDFANFTVDNIERVEILRGPQGTLYGSDAIGGVVQIITKKGVGKPTLTVYGEYGSYETKRGRVNLEGAIHRLSYSLSLLGLDTGGISAASEKNGGVERDGYENTTFSGRVGLAPLTNLDVELIGRYIDAQSNIDYSGGLVDDPNSIQETEQLFLRGQVKFPLLGGVWENVVGLGLSETERENRDEPDSGQIFQNSGRFRGKIVEGDWQGNIFLHERNILTLGVELKEERGSSETTFGVFPEESLRSESVFIQDQINIADRLFATLGGRLDHFESKGSEFTFRIAAAYNVNEWGTRLKGTVGTGFKAPTLFQLFDPAFGNPDLAPEESLGWDLGVEQEILKGRALGGGTYFSNDFEDQIDFVFTDPVTFEGQFVNTGKSRSQGVELFSVLRVIDPLTLGMNYTYTDAKNKDTGEFLLKRPRHKFNLTLDYHPGVKGNIYATLAYRGERHDIDPVTFERTVVGGYTVVNVAASYDVTKTVRCFTRIDNLLNREYEESSGFGTAGLSAYFGIAVTI